MSAPEHHVLGRASTQTAQRSPPAKAIEQLSGRPRRFDSVMPQACSALIYTLVAMN